MHYLTPGVYRRSRPQTERGLALVRTDVAGFVGIAERGPLPGEAMPGRESVELAVRVTSWKEYWSRFGGYTRYGYMPYAVRAFFENGGRACYVARVAATDHADPAERPAGACFAFPDGSAAAAVGALKGAVTAGAAEIELAAVPSGLVVGDLVSVSGAGLLEYAMVTRLSGAVLSLGRKLDQPHAAGDQVLRYASGLTLAAASKGGWGNRVRVQITRLEGGPTVRELALRLTVDGPQDPTLPREEEFYPHLSLDPASRYFIDLVLSSSRLVRVAARGTAIRAEGQTPLAGGFVYLEGGREGLNGLAPEDFIGSDLRPCGLRLLEDIDEIAILAVPDAVFDEPATPPPAPVVAGDPCAPPAVLGSADVPPDPTAAPPAPATARIQFAAVDQCERLRDRVTVLDPPANVDLVGVQAWRAALNSIFAATYWPWLAVPDLLAAQGVNRRVPPSGHLAGVYARTDLTHGVQRPPANVALEFVTDVTRELSSLDQESLNPFGINAIRSFPGRGIRVWGARSMAGPNDGDWRFIHVRRLLSMIEESVRESMQWTVFEPNDADVRRTVTHALNVFLEALWRAGGLKGATPAQGYYVKCDETNNPPEVAAAGQLVCQVGVAPAAPMEFIVFEVRQTAGAGATPASLSA